MEVILDSAQWEAASSLPTLRLIDKTCVQGKGTGLVLKCKSCDMGAFIREGRLVPPRISRLHVGGRRGGERERRRGAWMGEERRGRMGKGRRDGKRRRGERRGRRWDRRKRSTGRRERIGERKEQ